MGSTLSDLGATAFIGFAVVLGTFFLVRYIYPDWAILEKTQAKWSDGLGIAALGIICFGAGIVFEDLSWKYADHEIGFSIPLVVPDDDELKVRALLSDEKPSPLARQMAQAEALSTWPAHLPDDIRVAARQLESRLARSDSRFESREVEKLVGPVLPAYFQAKNACYRDSGFKEVLTEIQRRIDFTRSCCVLCVVLIILVTTLILLELVRRSRQPDPMSIDKSIVRRSLQSILVIMLICIAAGKAYEEEELRFNRRVFGYYLTMTSQASPPKTTYATTDENQLSFSRRETSVQSIDFNNQRKFARREFSSLAWLPGNNELGLLEQGSENEKSIPDGHLYCIKKLDLKTSIRHGAPIDESSVRRVSINADGIKEGLPPGYAFDGYESIAFGPDNIVWVTIECEPKRPWRAGSIGLLCQGKLQQGGESIKLEEIVAGLPSQTTVSNMAYESVVDVSNDVIAIHEANSVSKLPRTTGPMAISKAHRRIAFPAIPYRTTDATAVEDGSFWVLNFMFPGDRELRSKKDNLVSGVERGRTHAKAMKLGPEKQVVERLVEIHVRDKPLRFETGRVLQLELKRQGDGFLARNWEGIVRIDDPKGFIIVTDDNKEKHGQKLILGFVPFDG